MRYQGFSKPKAEYPLGKTFLQDKHIKKIEPASLPKIIVKFGYNRNMHIGIRGAQKS